MPNPYEIISDEDGYVFTTDFGITYRIVFDDLDTVFTGYPTLQGRVFSYSFYPTDPAVKRTVDIRVRDTISLSIAQFFRTHHNLIVFVCDSTDKKELGREKLFDLWFSKFNDGTLERYKGEVVGDDVSIRNTIIMNG